MRSPTVVLTVVALLVLGGCLATPPAGTPSQSVSVEDVTVVPGETTNVTIQASHVGELWFTEVPAGDGPPVAIQYRNVSFDPTPSKAVATLPPYWVWDVVHPTVTVEVPVRASEDASPGSYGLTVAALNGTDHDHDRGREASGTIRVVTGDEGT